MKELNFSIIIPHKNLPDLLQRCLDSIPRRNDTEIIIVDDNSDPDRVNFEDFPGSYRPDVRIILDKNNKGAGAARNIGIRNASGKWLLFADSDDTYTPELNNFLNNYKDSNFDVVYYKCNIISDGSKKKTISNMNIFIDKYIKSKKGIEDIKFGAWEPWNKLIKRSVVVDNGIQFDEISSSNDKMFSLYLGYYAHNVLAVDAIIYNYILRPGSIIHSGNRRFRNSFDTIIRQNEFYNKIGYERKISILLFLLKNYNCMSFNILQRYFSYLKINRANPFEGILSVFRYFIKRCVIHH